MIEERRDEKLPIVPLPSKQEIERRKLLANYGREVKGRTGNINLLHAMFVHDYIIGGTLFAWCTITPNDTTVPGTFLRCL